MRPLDISKKLFERYEATNKVWSYFGLLALWGLAMTADEDKDDALLDKCRSMLDLYPDGIEHPRYNFENYRAGGAGKAWLAMSGLYPGQETLLREYAEKTLSACHGSDGVICVPKDGFNRTWIDIAYAVPPYMLFTGLYLGEQKYVDYAARQCLGLMDIFYDPDCGLYHQGRGFMGNDFTISEDHWSRGNGWAMIGITELVKYLPENSQYRARAEETFVKFCASLLPYQTDKGLWRQEITEPLAWEETSGTALILYGIGAGIRLGLLSGAEFSEAFNRGIHGMCEWCIDKDFSTEHCCPGCLCPGYGEKIGKIQSYLTERLPYRNEQHSFGALMLALCEAHANGVTELTCGVNTRRWR